jgi:hypothetical protein
VRLVLHRVTQCGHILAFLLRLGPGDTEDARKPLATEHHLKVYLGMES